MTMLECPACAGEPHLLTFTDESDSRGEHYTADAYDDCRACRGTGVALCEGGCGPAVVEREIADAFGVRTIQMCADCDATDRAESRAQ